MGITVEFIEIVIRIICFVNQVIQIESFAKQIPKKWLRWHQLGKGTIGFFASRKFATFAA